MTDHLPYTYTDPDTGYTLSVSSTHLRIIDDDRVYDEMPAPTGEDAVALARAFLATGGGTGHVVVSREEIEQLRSLLKTAQDDRDRFLAEKATIAARNKHSLDALERSSMAVGAESMRRRYSDALLNLLELHGASDELIADAGRLDCLPLTPDEDTDDENPPCLAMSPTPDTHVPYECEGTAGHEGEHHALKGAVTWESEPDLASRITELEALAADQVDALEKHSRAIADLRTHMNGAQAAIRGLGKQASLHPTTENDL